MRTHPPRGVTLVELCIAMTITAVILAGAVTVMRTQQQAFQRGQKLRAAQGSARTALLYVEQALAMAGYGMDPALALDFGNYSPAATCPATMSPCSRDKVDNADEIVFYARNPRYSAPEAPATDPTGNAWRVKETDNASNTITVFAHGGETFPKGQIVQVVCRQGKKYFYGTVATAATAGAAAPNLALTLTLEQKVTANPFRRQDAVASDDGCITAQTARLFLIDRFRFHVRPVDQGGGKYDPYLVLDRGIDVAGSSTGGPDTKIDENDEQIVAEGIETIQFAYVFANTALAVAGTTPGTAIVVAAGPTTTTPKYGVTTAQHLSTTPFPQAFDAATQTVYDPTSWFTYTMGPPMAGERTTDNQANVRQVRIAVVGRSPEPDPEHAESFPLPVFNQDTAPAWIADYAAAVGGRDGYSRVRVDATVTLSNMVGRGQVYF